MKKWNYFKGLLGAFALISLNATSQEFPWPDFGAGTVIEPGAPGVINNTITANNANPPKAGKHYILKRGATYLYTGYINNVGWPLMITAEAGDGPLPIIKALGPPEGATEAPRAFHAQGSLYVKDVHIIGRDQGDKPTDNATIRLAADSITVVAKNCIFDFNRQNPTRINAKECKVYFENCIIGNQGEAKQVDNGFALTFRGNWTPLVHYRNNTFYNCTHYLINNIDLKRYGKLILENNTIVNLGYGGADFGRPDSLIVRNNLFVNPGILGDARFGDRARFAEPFHFFSLDSNEVDLQYKAPYVDFDHNQFIVEPELITMLPDSANDASLFMFDEELTDLIGDNNEILKIDFDFTNFPVTNAQYKDFIDDFYNFVPLNPSELPGFDLNVLELDFGYLDNKSAARAASDGGRLGDRNWALVPSSVGDNALESGVYPNPFADYLMVKNAREITRVALVNALGKEVYSAVNTGNNEMRLDLSTLSPGFYISVLYKGETPAVSYKVMK